MSDNGVNYRSVLSDLRMRKLRLDAAISAIESILGELPTAPEARSEPEDLVEKLYPTPIATPTGTYSDMTIAASAIHFLGSVGKPQSTGDIAKALKKGGLSSTSKNLYRTLYNTLNNRLDKEITKNGAKWGLKQWQ